MMLFAMVSGPIANHALAQANASTATTGQAAESAEVFVQTGNALQITTARFSPDGQWIASCDGLGSVVVWDATSGRQFREVHRHTGMCLGVDFTPDGQNLVSSGGARSGNDVVLSRRVDGVTLQTWHGHKGYVRDVVATRDGLGAWSLGEADGLKRWTRGSANPVQEITLALPNENAQVPTSSSALALSRDQTHAYVARRDGSIVRVDLRSNGSTVPVVTRLAQGPEAISALALSPDERILAVSYGILMGATQREVHLLDAATGEPLSRLNGHTGNVFAVAFSPDGSLLAAAAQIDANEMLAGKLKEIRQQESIRIWRVADGRLVADVRNQRNVNGTPFLRGSLDFARTTASSQDPPRLVLALWDEAARVYELTATDISHADNVLPVRLVHTLEGRGLSPRQLQASDTTSRLLLTDGRPRIAPADTFLNATAVRREFGQADDWTPERLKRLDVLYAGRGWLTQSQRASLWDLKTGRLERVLDWHRAPVSDLGLDGQGNFVSSAPLFPQTIMVAPLKTRIVREATADADGNLSYHHFSYEPWDGPADEIFLPPTATTDGTNGANASDPVAGTDAGEQVAHAGAYSTDLVIMSPTQRWSVVAGVPIQDKQTATTSGMSPRLFVVERLTDGRRKHRYDLATPGLILAIAIAADEKTLWVSGTTRGLPHNDSHEAWLMAIDLSDGSITRSWQLARGVTVTTLIAHPAGNQVITNGSTGLSVWDKTEATRKYRVEASVAGRNLRALAISDDGRQIISTDLSGWTVLWDWPPHAAPVKKWARQLAQPSPHLLKFMGHSQRIAAGAVDGSVRILAATDGSEIARMIRFDNDQWITMIPEGYFVASQEGDRWVNVRLGGRVYGIDQFYDVFYRPDIVERKLAGQPIDSLITVTIDEALRHPPPRVALRLAPGQPVVAGQTIKAQLQVDSQGGGVGEVRLLHNGKLMSVLNRANAHPPSTTGNSRPSAEPGTAGSDTGTSQSTLGSIVGTKTAAAGAETVTRALRLAAKTLLTQSPTSRPVQTLSREIEIELVAGENSVTAIGFNAAGNLNSRPLTQQIQASGTAPPPRVFLLAVGVDQFMRPDRAPTLQFAVKDSTDFASAVRERLGSTYRDAPMVVRILHNQAATRQGLLDALEELKKEVRPTDLLIWFVASHGTLDSQAQYGIVLHDWDGRFNESSLFSTAQILEAARSIRAFNQFVILDTCHAGGISSLVRGLYDARLVVLARNMGLHVFASASATEEAVDGYLGNGLFTHTLLTGLKTPAADKNSDRLISIHELGDYARRETKRIARQVFSRSQDPLLMNFGKDVTVYAVK